MEEFFEGEEFPLFMLRHLLGVYLLQVQHVSIQPLYGARAPLIEKRERNREIRFMDIEQAIAGRRSVRDYTEAAVDEAVIGRLIETAVLAPSAMNEQPFIRSRQTFRRRSATSYRCRSSLGQRCNLLYEPSTHGSQREPGDGCPLRQERTLQLWVEGCVRHAANGADSEVPLGNQLSVRTEAKGITASPQAL
ncbi:MAG: nitroreductase family protein [Hyphomicrobium sp.]|jgi:hypothetical protein